MTSTSARYKPQRGQPRRSTAQPRLQREREKEREREKRGEENFNPSGMQSALAATLAFPGAPSLQAPGALIRRSSAALADGHSHVHARLPPPSARQRKKKIDRGIEMNAVTQAGASHGAVAAATSKTALSPSPASAARTAPSRARRQQPLRNNRRAGPRAADGGRKGEERAAEGGCCWHGRLALSLSAALPLPFSLRSPQRTFHSPRWYHGHFLARKLTHPLSPSRLVARTPVCQLPRACPALAVSFVVASPAALALLSLAVPPAAAAGARVRQDKRLPALLPLRSLSLPPWPPLGCRALHRPSSPSRLQVCAASLLRSSAPLRVFLANPTSWSLC